MGKSVMILVALGLGLLLPQLGELSFTLRPFLMTLLFFSFLEVKVDREMFAWPQLVVAVLLPFIGLLVYWLGSWYSEDLALTLFLMGLAPTAVITPVLAALMGRSVAYMVGAIIVTHAVFAAVVPFILPRLLGVEMSLRSLGELVFTIGSTVLVPLVLGQLVRYAGGRFLEILQRVSPFTFALFLSNIAVAAGSLSYYLHNEEAVGWSMIGVTAVAILTLMLLNFWVGSRLVAKHQRVEGSLALGRKNTMLAIWVALEYINPLVVLGPMLYILAQNVFVAGQIVYVARRGGSVAVPLEP